MRLQRPRARKNTERFKAVRQGLRWSQKELAWHLGVRADTVSRYECGARTIPEPTMRLIERLASEFWYHEQQRLPEEQNIP